MNRAEFIRELTLKLAKLPSYEIDKAILFYTESIADRIEDGMSEDEAVASLGEIDKIVGEIFIDIPLATLIQSKIKESHDKSSNKTLWTVLAICGSPLWLPIALLLASALLLVYISVWMVVLALFLVEFSLSLAGLFGFLSGIVLCFTKSFSVGLALIGMGVTAAGLFIMTIKPLFWICKQFIALTVVFLGKIKKLFISKGGEIK